MYLQMPLDRHVSPGTQQGTIAASEAERSHGRDPKAVTFNSSFPPSCRQQSMAQLGASYLRLHSSQDKVKRYPEIYQRKL